MMAFNSTGQSKCKKCDRPSCQVLCSLFDLIQLCVSQFLHFELPSLRELRQCWICLVQCAVLSAWHKLAALALQGKLDIHIAVIAVNRGTVAIKRLAVIRKKESSMHKKCDQLYKDKWQCGWQQQQQQQKRPTSAICDIGFTECFIKVTADYSASSCDNKQKNKYTPK